MASARTPASTKSESMGSMTLLIVKFSAILHADTWASGLGTSPIAYWTAVTTAPAVQTNCGSMAALSAGGFTFDVDEDTQDLTLFILV